MTKLPAAREIRNRISKARGRPTLVDSGQVSPPSLSATHYPAGRERALKAKPDFFKFTVPSRGAHLQLDEDLAPRAVAPTTQRDRNEETVVRSW